MFSLPTEMKFHRLSSAVRLSAGRLRSSEKYASPNPNETPTDRQPSQCPHRSASRPDTSSTAALASGMATISHMFDRRPVAGRYSTDASLVLQQVRVVDAGR